MAKEAVESVLVAEEEARAILDKAKEEADLILSRGKEEEKRIREEIMGEADKEIEKKKILLEGSLDKELGDLLDRAKEESSSFLDKDDKDLQGLVEVLLDEVVSYGSP